MSTMIEELYDALKDAGADDEKARRAARAMADYESKFTAIESRLSAIDGRLVVMDGRSATLESRIDAVKAETALLK